MNRTGKGRGPLTLGLRPPWDCMEQAVRLVSVFCVCPLFLGVSFLCGCSAGYLLHLGAGQARIVLEKKPVAEVLEKGALPGERREKLLLVLEAKEFGETEIGLARSRNYTFYYEVPGPAVAYNLTACPALSLDPHTWCFPIAGCLPYKGFFDRDRALAEARKMAKAGYDTLLRPVAAYSTLGWFSDPVFSTMLDYEEADLVETILHEMVHRTVFLRHQGAFNEALATFVAERGSLAFFTRRRPGAAPVAERLEAARLDRKRLHGILSTLAGQLRSVYAAPGEERDKIAEKERLFAEGRKSLEDALPLFHDKRYGRLLAQTWNNAFLASYLTYHQNLDVFDALLRALGGDLRALVDCARALRSAEDPFEQVRGWVETGPDSDCCSADPD